VSRDERQAHILRCALAEVGYPEPSVVGWMAERGCWGISSHVPIGLVWRAFCLLAHSEGLPYPDEAEYVAWIAAGSPISWWHSSWEEAS
jgi:hypothetical protein